MRRDPLLVVVLTLVTALAVLPFAVGEHLPVLELPSLVAETAIFRHVADADLGLGRAYEIVRRVAPGCGWLLLTALLEPIFGALGAARVLLAAYGLLLPLGALALARRFGRSPWLALFAAPLVWNRMLAKGLCGWLLGVAVLPWALVALDRHLERPTSRRSAVAVGLGLGLLLLHPLVFAFYLPLALALCLAARRGGWRALVPFGVTLLAALIVASRDLAALRGGRLFLRGTLASAITHWSTQLLDVRSGGADEATIIVLGVAWIGLAAAAHHEEASPPRSWIIELGALLALAAALLLPEGMTAPFVSRSLGARHFVVLALFLALVPRGSITGGRRWMLAPVALAGVWHGAIMIDLAWRFEHRVRGFRDVVAHITPGERTLVLDFGGRADGLVNERCLPRFGGYVLAWKGGYSPELFDDGDPVREREPLPAPPLARADLFDGAAHGVHYDYLLTHLERNSPVFLSQREGMTLLSESGDWHLWWHRRSNVAPSP